MTANLVVDAVCAAVDKMQGTVDAMHSNSFIAP